MAMRRLRRSTKLIVGLQESRPVAHYKFRRTPQSPHRHTPIESRNRHGGPSNSTHRPHHHRRRERRVGHRPYTSQLRHAVAVTVAPETLHSPSTPRPLLQKREVQLMQQRRKMMSLLLLVLLLEHGSVMCSFVWASALGVP